MKTRHLLAAFAFASSFASALGACTSSEPDVAKTAADAAIVGPTAAPTASVLSPGFDPQSLAPGGATPASSSDAGGHEHHHHHQP